MDRKQILGVAGAIILGIGAFCPIVSMKAAGALTFFNQGRGDGVILLALAAGALMLAILRRQTTLLASAVGAAGLVGYDLYRFWVRLDQARAELAAGGASPEQLAGAPQLSWGWLVMAAGLALLFAAHLAKAADSRA